MAGNTPTKHVKIRTGLHRIEQVGPIAICVDRVTGRRALVCDAPEPINHFPVPLDDEQYLQLGIAMIRDSGTIYDFSEPLEDQEEAPAELPRRMEVAPEDRMEIMDRRPPEG